jgi:hypothetical protein
MFDVNIIAVFLILLAWFKRVFCHHIPIHLIFNKGHRADASFGAGNI